MTAADFTGDGFSDLAVRHSSSPVTGGPDEWNFRRLGVYRGTADGVGSEPFWSDNDVPVSDLAGGDVNGDGRAELIIGGVATSGGVRVYRATGTGFAAPQVITQDSADVPGTHEPGDEFGDTVRVGDVNGDGLADVAAGAPGEDVGAVSNAGAVTVLYGTANGISGTGSQMFGQDSAGLPGTSEENGYFGQILSLADVTGDGRADLTAGSPGENDFEGAVWVMRGTAGGLTVDGVLAFNPGTVGVAGRNARFAEALLP